MIFHLRSVKFQVQYCILPADLPAPHAWYGAVLCPDGAAPLEGGQVSHQLTGTSGCTHQEQE